MSNKYHKLCLQKVTSTTENFVVNYKFEFFSAPAKKADEKQSKNIKNYLIGYK
jgi:hypothetical protein